MNYEDTPRATVRTGHRAAAGPALPLGAGPARAGPDYHRTSTYGTNDERLYPKDSIKDERSG